MQAEVDRLLRDVRTTDPQLRHDIAAQLSKVAAKAEGALRQSRGTILVPHSLGGPLAAALAALQRRTERLCLVQRRVGCCRGPVAPVLKTAASGALIWHSQTWHLPTHANVPSSACAACCTHLSTPPPHCSLPSHAACHGGR